MEWVTATQFRFGRAHYVICPAPFELDVRLHWYRLLCKHAPTILTVFHAPKDVHVHLGADFLERTVKQYLHSDDVFRKEFLQGIVFWGDNFKPKLEVSAEESLDSWGTKWKERMSRRNGDPILPPGPYVIKDNDFFQIWKLYDDFNKAFLVSTWPSQTIPGGFENLHASGDAYTCLAIAVPSRLYFEKTKDRPLNGVRIAVKDIFHLKGVKTSCCSRGYHDLYPPQEMTATSIQRLIDLGAIVVGKTHLSSFALREEPTECVDYQAPFNPRADGYQSPAGSSSGSGAAIASYDWLDYTFGTDTTGSGRRPALWNGSFGLRPSSKLLSPDGMVPTCPTFDSPCLFGRDINRIPDLIIPWYERPLKPQGPSDRPWSILYPTDFLPVGNAEQMAAINIFTKQLASFLNVKAKRVSLKDHWAKTSPVAEKELDVFMLNTQEHGFFYDAYHCFDEYRRDHEEAYKKPPYVTEVVRWMWGIARLLNESQRDEALHRFDIFRQWFIDEILQVHSQRAVMILPIEKLEPRYRDKPPELPSVPPMSINVLFVSPTIGGPELTVPIAEVAYNSRVTNKMEFLPCAVSLLGAPDTDLELVGMVQAFLKDTGRPASVKTGPSMGEAFVKHRQVPQTTRGDESWFA